MELVQADGLDAEALGRCLGGLLDVGGVAVLGPGAVAGAQVPGLGGDQDAGGVGAVRLRSASAMSSSLCPTSPASRWYASAVSMNVTPASSAAWMVAMDCARSGRPSMDMGMPPRPMAETERLPMVRSRTVTSSVEGWIPFQHRKR